MRHKWVMQTNGCRCAKCGMLMRYGRRPKKRGFGHAARTTFKPRGGIPFEPEDRKIPPCTGVPAKKVTK